VVQDRDTVACIVDSVKSADDVPELTTSDLSGVVGGKATSDKPVKIYLVFQFRQVL
jgi:hypothetical protein